MKTVFPILAALAAAVAIPLESGAEVRTWTDVSGRKVEGELLSVTGDSIKLRVDGKEFTLPVSKFSEPDQAFIRGWKPAEPSAPAVSPLPSVPSGTAAAGGGMWPPDVVVDLDMNIATVKEDKAAKEFIYRSPHFEFKSDIQLSTSLVREFCRVFEATYETVKQLPVGLEPKAPEGGYYLTELFRTKAGYFDAGGIPGSGGMYSGRGKKIMIPLENLGVRDVGNRFVVDASDDNETLKHEITHQVMHYWLGRLPVWFTEGWAEYIAAAPYSKGRYRFTGIDRAVRDDILDGGLASGKEFRMIGIERLMTITHEAWAEALTEDSDTAGRNYKSSMLLMYFFLHMDKGENGENMAAFLEAIKGGLGYDVALEKFFLRGRSYADVGEALQTAWRSEGMRIEF